MPSLPVHGIPVFVRVHRHKHVRYETRGFTGSTAKPRSRADLVRGRPFNEAMLRYGTALEKRQCKCWD
ncbi:unnamed protein product [Closterium sp. Yama58-4]|nr:unnamed protein product [Closterium sp. Yama58-4]